MSKKNTAEPTLHTHDGVHYHSHEPHSENHSHGTHPHHHDPASTKAIINRMNRAIGHMESIKSMVEDDRDCSEVLIQIAAVRSAINNIGKLILEEHIQHCVTDAVESGDDAILEELRTAINKFIK